MTYVNVTETFVDPIACAAHEWSHFGETSDEQTYWSCGAHLATLPASIFTGAVDALIGLGSGICMVCTAFTTYECMGVKEVAVNHLESASGLLTRLYLGLVRAANPLTQFPEDALVSSNGYGFLSGLVIDSLVPVAEACAESDTLLVQHGASRLTYVLIFACMLIARILDLLIGVSAALFSIISFGKIEVVNNIALRNLPLPVMELFHIPSLIINPWVALPVESESEEEI